MFGTNLSFDKTSFMISITIIINLGLTIPQLDPSFRNKLKPERKLHICNHKFCE